MLGRRVIEMLEQEVAVLRACLIITSLAALPLAWVCYWLVYVRRTVAEVLVPVLGPLLIVFYLVTPLLFLWQLRRKQRAVLLASAMAGRGASPGCRGR